MGWLLIGVRRVNLDIILTLSNCLPWVPGYFHRRIVICLCGLWGNLQYQPLALTDRLEKAQDLFDILQDKVEKAQDKTEILPIHNSSVSWAFSTMHEVCLSDWTADIDASQTFGWHKPSQYGTPLFTRKEI